MATRGVEGARAGLETSTEFHVHISQRMNSKDRPIDFTEQRIKWMYDLERDPQKKLILTAALVDYKVGAIAISWRSGELVYLRVTKDR